MPFELAVTVDGPTASGKSSLARALAMRLNAVVLDTGWTYRAVAYATLKEQLDADYEAVFRVIDHRMAGQSPAEQASIVYRGEDVTDKIWSADVEMQLRKISTSRPWRACITEYHERLLCPHSRVIAVGRDCATALLKDATYSIFLTAAHAIRKERRRAQYLNSPDRAVDVGRASAVDEASKRFVADRPNGFVIDTTFLPRSVVWAAVLFHLGEAL